MANRIIGNVYIVDSALNNVALPWNLGSRVSALALWSGSTAGSVTFTGEDTTNCIAKLSFIQSTTGGSITPAYQFISFASPVSFDNMKVPFLTAGTAWIYFA